MLSPLACCLLHALASDPCSLVAQYISLYIILFDVNCVDFLRFAVPNTVSHLIYKRKQESKKTRKHAFEESDQEKKKERKKTSSRPRKRPRKRTENTLSTPRNHQEKRKTFFHFFLLSCFLL